MEETKEILEEEKKEYEIVGIRFKNGGKMYYFDSQGVELAPGENAIVETARGLEYGNVALGNKILPVSELVMPLRPVIRKATSDDTRRHEENHEKEEEAAKVFAQKIVEHKLEMKLVDVEYTFDNSKLLFYFTSDGRVDFRELVKDLASIFRTRIELRQIGIRDETKMIGGLGVCGRPYCCKKFLDDFGQVSIKMAKEQNLSLNSQKISGACGRLMCCLRYEHEAYEDALKNLPKVESYVETPDGNGTVTELVPLAGIVKVRLAGEQGVIRQYAAESVKVLASKTLKSAYETKEDD
ncbi:MAG: stage 0 sporulation family protein [Clostridia bacterium]|nr:stage 0 sporulation family protein [Clostridia bacterium]